MFLEGIERRIKSGQKENFLRLALGLIYVENGMAFLSCLIYFLYEIVSIFVFFCILLSYFCYPVTYLPFTSIVL